jgi:hypothetical protein
VASSDGGWRARIGLAHGLTLALWAVVARAGDAGESEPVRFEYSAPQSCPGEADFVRAIELHTSRFRLAREGESARTFQVKLADSDSGAMTGSLVVLEGGVALEPRSVRAQTCAEALDALAFIAALSIDPRAESSTSALPTAGAAGVAAAAASPAPETPPTPTLPTPTLASHVENSLAPTRGAAGQSRWVAGAGTEVLGLDVPEVVAALRAFVGWRWETARLVSPEVRLSFYRSFDAGVDKSATRTTFAWTFGRLEFSPVRLGTWLSGELVPFFDVGVLTGQGGGTTQTFSPTSPWVTAGALARVAIRPNRYMILEGYGGGLVTFFRKNFLYSPSPSAYTPPPGAPCGGIDAAVLFP